MVHFERLKFTLLSLVDIRPDVRGHRCAGLSIVRYVPPFGKGSMWRGLHIAQKH